MFTLTINTDSFETEEDKFLEIACILERVLRSIDHNTFVVNESNPLFDINGNRVGTVELV